MIKKYSFLIAAFLLAPLFCSGQDTALLGGMVQSDRWIIRKDKMEEEFIGNVSYKNNIYTVTSDYGLSRRKEQTFTLKGNVFAQRNNQDGTMLTFNAGSFFYDKKADGGNAEPKKNAQIEGIYKTPNNRLKIYSDSLAFRDKFSFFNLGGNCELQDINNTLYAQTMTFDTKSGLFNAQGGRPLLWGFSPDGDYALQADNINTDTQNRIFTAQGRVRGWVVSAKEFNFNEGNKNGTKIF